jgi:hypothetical protein
MMSFFASRVRADVAARSTKVAVLVAMALALTGDAWAVGFSLGPKEVIYWKNQRQNKKLNMWPDGNLGVVRNAQGGYDFYGANGKSPAKTSGTLLDPAGWKQSVSISGLPRRAYDYVSGGPIYQDPTSGLRLMIYHAETHGKSAKDYYSMLGLAASTDPAGRYFWDLGTIVKPNQPGGQFEIGGGTFAVMDGYLNVYFRDKDVYGNTSELAVARAPLTSIISNAWSGQGTSFTKYYNGNWTQPGLGGMASPLENGNPFTAWSSVSYNDYLNQLVMVTAGWFEPQPNLYLSTSSDGINWSPRQALVTDAGEQFYPTIIGTGADPTHSDQSFYVYYTDSMKGSWNRWKDAQLVRRQITLDTIVSPTPPIPLGPDDPSTNWVNVAGYREDFQAGGPAAGWKYMWSATGTRGNAANFAPLYWSDTAQAYNTNGGLTTAPIGQFHSDDYLTLNSWGGHPGRSNFSAIAGYTIQEEDGAGLYRLAETTIQKIDSIASAQEDGLGVLVYVNDTLLGPLSTVSTNGGLTGFDRDLGQLNVGDTVWVLVDALQTLYNDSFMNFDFSIQKSNPIIATATLAMSQLMNVEAVPEPGAVMLLLISLAGFYLKRPARRRL